MVLLANWDGDIAEHLAVEEKMGLMMLFPRAQDPAERGSWIERVDGWMLGGGMELGDCGEGELCNC